jgi:hypothetical protein
MVLRGRLTDHPAVLQEAEDTLAEAVTPEAVTPEGADNLATSKLTNPAHSGGV